MIISKILHGRAVRGIAKIVMICFVIVQYGCATRPPSIDLHWQLRNEVTALTPAQLQTKLSLEPYTSGRPAGALKGAGQGAMSMLDAMGGGSLHCEGWPCGLVLVMILAIVVTAAGVGAVVGAIKATLLRPGGRLLRNDIYSIRQLLSVYRSLIGSNGYSGGQLTVVCRAIFLGLNQVFFWKGGLKCIHG